MITSTHVLGLFVPKFWVQSHHCRPYWRPLSTLGGNRRCAVWVLQALDACLLVACYTMITLTQLFGFFVLFWAYSSIQGVLQAPGGPWCTLGSTENSARTPIHHRNKQVMFNDVITTKNTSAIVFLHRGRRSVAASVQSGEAPWCTTALNRTNKVHIRNYCHKKPYALHPYVVCTFVPNFERSIRSCLQRAPAQSSYTCPVNPCRVYEVYVICMHVVILSVTVRVQRYAYVFNPWSVW